ncbi:MAG: hypothetical protein C4523_19460 [Myxococcales bacterium]|nr:MAG: hypothetical protein C4523_19460 [Myxococcales bacterium]
MSRSNLAVFLSFGLWLVLLLAACSSGESVDFSADSDEAPTDGDATSDGDEPPADGDGDAEPADGDNDIDAELSDGDEETDAEPTDGDAPTDGDLTGGDADEVEAEEIETEEEISGCADALALECGDRLAHSTVVQGRPNEWFGYGCSARAESGRETIYAFQTDEDCQVEVRLTNLVADIDLFLLSDCNPFTCEDFSSTPLGIQDVETVSFETEAGQRRFVVVDGYAEDEGDYTIEVDCACP